jgi:hypothetical protein
LPGVYRKKNCPHCGIEHRGRGQFCSVACSNSHREVKPETRAKISEIQQDHAAQTAARMRKQHADNNKRKAGEYVLQEDDWYVLPPSDDEDDGVVL